MKFILPCILWGHFPIAVSVLAQLNSAHEMYPLATGKISPFTNIIITL